jgi:hypothetical protein
VQLSGNPTQQAYCSPDKMTECSRLSRYGMTYKPLTEDRGEELLMSYLAAFHARHLRSRKRSRNRRRAVRDVARNGTDHSRSTTSDSSLWKDSPMLTSRGLGVVLGDLASLGFDAKWGGWEQQTLAAPDRARQKCWIRLPTPTAHNAKETNAPSEALRNEPTLASRVGGN